MKSELMLKVIGYLIHEGELAEDEEGDVSFAIYAIEKQIPKPPLQACGHTTEPWMYYCPRCGQRLDWTKEDEK